jgi:hypothetical protein
VPGFRETEEATEESGRQGGICRPPVDGQLQHTIGIAGEDNPFRRFSKAFVGELQRNELPDE